MLNRDDVQNGNILSGPSGDRRVGGRIQSDAGQFVVLVDDDGHGTLIQDGVLYDHEEYNLNRRLAASGVASAQEASEVEALRSELATQSRLVQALLDRDQAREAVTQAERPADPPVPGPEPASGDTPGTTPEAEELARLRAEIADLRGEGKPDARPPAPPLTPATPFVPTPTGDRGPDVPGPAATPPPIPMAPESGSTSEGNGPQEA